MTELSCAQCHELASELALGVLGGRERADAIAHLSRCPRCQYKVSALATTAARLVELVPETDVPPGFDQRVIAAITPPAPEPSLARRGLPVAALALTGVLLAGGGWVFGQLLPVQPAGLPVRSVNVQPVADVMVSPLIAGNREIGEAYVYPNDPSWIFVSITDDPTGSGSSAVSTRLTCELVHDDGSTVTLGSFPLQHGHADWAIRTPIDSSGVDGAKLTTDTGLILASAHFTPAAVTPNTALDADRRRRKSDTDNSDADSSRDKDQDKDSDHKDSHGKDSHGKDSHSKDSHGKDSHGKDSHGKDSHGKKAHDK
ncbi:zf-HC2 domain-containing protein [Pseudonocardia sp. Cha107L01]|uniref:zf-HC2 domain-containing protein n=1 Tax=Pseudonocardia sp. Cha107L01 TaxID=3457576 RepID=UPI00403E86E9